MKNILLIGGGGFIGHNLSIKLKQLGNSVSIVDCFQVNNLLNILTDKKKYDKYNPFCQERIRLLMDNNVNIYIEDARKYNELSYLIQTIKPEVVIHLAAVSHANISNKKAHSTFDHSLRTLENALDASIKGDIVKQFVYFSSSMVYGDWTEEVLTEKSPTNPLGVYGSLKLAGEMIVRSYGRVFGLPYTIIRPSALYGERCISRRIVQIFIEDALEGKDLSIIGDINQKLDFTYIDDLVDGLCLAIGNFEAYDETFNMTYGEGRSIFDLVTVLDNLMGVAIQRREETDENKPSRGTLSVDKARRILRYRPEYNLEKGVEKYLKWYKEKKR